MFPLLGFSSAQLPRLGACPLCTLRRTPSLGQDSPSTTATIRYHCLMHQANRLEMLLSTSFSLFCQLARCRGCKRGISPKLSLTSFLESIMVYIWLCPGRPTVGPCGTSNQDPSTRVRSLLEGNVGNTTNFAKNKNFSSVPFTKHLFSERLRNSYLHR